MDTFINKAIENGIVNYLRTLNNEPLDKTHIFELHVIQILILIYGEINIINPYKLKNSKSFLANLKLYNLQEQTIKRFINLMEDYDMWLNSTNSSKNDIVNDIETILLQMVLCKNNYGIIKKEEFQTYEDFFSLKNKDIVRINKIVSFDPEAIIKLWEKKKSYFSQFRNSNLQFTNISPNLLSQEQYDKHGINLNDLSQLSNQAIDKLNEEILKEENANESTGGTGKHKPLQLILTSGSGFVDTIVLLSIMATEIMIGLLIAFTIARR